MKIVSCPQFLHAIKQTNVLCIDVRTRDEFLAGSIPGVRNMPLQNLENFAHEFTAGLPIYIHCKTGQRATFAAEWLEENTDCEVFVFMGGYKEWQESL